MHKRLLAVRRCNVLCWGERREPSACQGVTSTTGDWSSAGDVGGGAISAGNAPAALGGAWSAVPNRAARGPAFAGAFAQVSVVYSS